MQALRPDVPGMKKSLRNSSHYVRSIGGSTPTQSCSTWVMNKISELINGKTITPQINERFPPLNNVGVSFAMLF